MKKFRKGFTLVELLIVIAVIGSLSAMMMYSSSGAVDSADASKILSNLQTLKMAAMQMYMDEPEVASLTKIALDGSTKVGAKPAKDQEDTRETVAGILGAYLGKKADALLTSTTAGSEHTSKYGLLGNATSWYVVYTFDEKDSTGVKAKLAAKAEEADIYGTAATTLKVSSFTDYYQNNGELYIALKVR